METSPAAEVSGAVDLDQIISDLDAGHERIPVAAIRAAREHRELIVPRLIQLIRDAATAAREGNPPEGDAHFFALFLLTEFEAKEALPAIVEALSLPDELPFDLFGDAVTSLGGRILATLAGDRPDLIAELAGNRDLNLYVRWESASAFVLLVADGRMTRYEAVRRLQRQLRNALDIGESETEFISALVTTLADLAPREAMAEIEEAFQRDLVDESWVGLDDVKQCANRTEAEMLADLRRYRRGKLTDMIAELEGWASFFEDDFDLSDTGLSPLVDRTTELPYLSAAPLFDQSDSTVRVTTPRIGRNDPCPCGSGKKFKKCCGARK
jgi:uncharacterized protein DUF1186/SEC-C motif-containing protein